MDTCLDEGNVQNCKRGMRQVLYHEAAHAHIQGWHKKPSAKNPPRVFFKKPTRKNEKKRWVLLGFLGFLGKFE